MTKSHIFLFLLLSFVLGVFVRSFFLISSGYCFLLLVFSLIMLFLFYRNKFVVSVSFFISIFIFGIWITDREIAKTENLPHLGKNLQKDAIVEKATPSSFGQNVVVYFSNEKILVLLQVPQYPQYAYGDLLRVKCVLKSIENRDSAFDYQMYMAKEGVFYQCEKEKVQKVGENQGSWIYAKIISIRKMFENNITKVIPQPYGALASGLLFGGSNGLSKDIQNDFSQTGMTHIVAVSGYNVTIIAEYLIFIGLLLGLWRKQAIWFAVFGIAFFVIMIGMPSSAVRAGAMSGILLWAMKNGRLANSENAIIFACSIMLMLNPLLLRWDIGFQLSFMATLGIVASASFWEKSFAKKHKAMGISEIIVLSLSAQIFVLPIIAYNFHIVSPISLLANVFILPIVPFSMLMVFLVSVFGFVYEPLSFIFAWFAFLPLFYEIKLIHVLAEFPWASFSFENVSEYFVSIYYIILAGLIFWNKRVQKRIKLEKLIFSDDQLINRSKKGK